MINIRHSLVLGLLLIFGIPTHLRAQQPQVEKESIPNSLNLYLSLAHGFLNQERVIILQVTSKGDTTQVFSDKLIRAMGVDDVNFFTIRIERGKVNELIVHCPKRGAKFSQLFFFHRSNSYLELGINMRNEFRAMAQDTPSVKE